MTQIAIGSNDIREYSIVEADGTTPVVISSLSMLQLDVVQYHSTRATFVLGLDPEIRVGSDTDKLEVEIPVALSRLLKEGEVKGRLTMEKPDSNYVIDTKDIKVSYFDMFEATTIQTDFDSSGGGGGGANLVYDEIPTGAIDGVNTTFTLANTPVLNSLFLVRNGLTLYEGDDYTLTGPVITMAIAPSIGSLLRAEQYEI